jgi:hypothetical protein
MASPFQQQALVRKVTYLGLILVLFTGSLLHRNLSLKPHSTRLLLREENLGEVGLTDSAVRLALTGSKGFMTTFLWLGVLEKQKKNEWNEMELLVDSLTQLQPHFITPWLFQSWNMAFNVAVELDRPQDKYFYVSRGLQLLARGERKNRGDPSLGAPGNPEMRFHMGFTTQLKIGQSDEKNYMRSLFELSCIDPLRRDPDKLETAVKGGRQVDLVAFKQFCERYPRLVRRLFDRLDCTRPESVVRFLRENRDVPSRFETPREGQQESLLKPADQQFPLLPPELWTQDRLYRYPLPEQREFGPDEDFDNFVVCRAWYTYAQQPLPPTDPDPYIAERKFDRLRHRKSRMADVLFRGYPSRAQAYFAENLELEGWFDADGWRIKGRNVNWFDKLPKSDPRGVQVGTEPKYRAMPAWQKTNQMILDYGKRIGLWLPPEEVKRLENEAQLFVKKFSTDGVPPPQLPATAARDPKMRQSFVAHQRLKFYNNSRTLTNFADHLNQSEVEMHPETILARKLFFEALELRKTGDYTALEKFEVALPLWRNLLLENASFRRLPGVQSDTYELQMKYLRTLQNKHQRELRNTLAGVTKFGQAACAACAMSGPGFLTGGEVLPLGQGTLEGVNLLADTWGMFDLLVYQGPPPQEGMRALMCALTQTTLQPPLPVFQVYQALLSSRDKTDETAWTQMNLLLPSGVLCSLTQSGLWPPLPVQQLFKDHAEKNFQAARTQFNLILALPRVHHPGLDPMFSTEKERLLWAPLLEDSQVDEARYRLGLPRRIPAMPPEMMRMMQERMGGGPPGPVPMPRPKPVTK